MLKWATDLSAKSSPHRFKGKIHRDQQGPWANPRTPSAAVTRQLRKYLWERRLGLTCFRLQPHAHRPCQTSTDKRRQDHTIQTAPPKARNTTNAKNTRPSDRAKMTGRRYE